MPKPAQVVEGTAYPIQPRDINISGQMPLLSTFGHRETELAAIFIIQMCQVRREWAALRHRELDEAYARTPEGQYVEKHSCAYKMPLPPGVERHLFCFYDLIDGEMVVLGKDGKYRVTEAFIERCHNRNPANRP